VNLKASSETDLHPDSPGNYAAALTDAPAEFELEEFISGDVGTVDGSLTSYWLQVRGRTHVKSAEGRFGLSPGTWICLGRGSAPVLEAMPESRVIGLVGPSESMQRLTLPLDLELFPGIGTLSQADQSRAIELWTAARRANHAPVGDTSPYSRGVRAFLAHACTGQMDLQMLVHRAPGRSHQRRSQIFQRLQKALLYVLGHSERVVRAEELAALTNYSTWGLTRTLSDVYGYGLQAASFRARTTRAGWLVSNSRLTITEISAQCGFESPAAFARAFKQRYGVSASQYRASPQPVESTDSVFRPDYVNGAAPVRCSQCGSNERNT
jgi:AraC family transcriptional regulator